MHAFETTVRENFETTGPGTSQRNAIRKKPSRDALNILAALLQHNSCDAVRAGLISWLVEYPFGGYDDFPEGKKKILTDIRSRCYEDPAMHTILTFAKANPESRMQLVQHGLVDKAKDSFEGEEFGSEWMRLDRVEADLEWAIQSRMRGSRRMREESVEEQALRRRRREAMVLGEIGRPIERADIIERRNTGQEEEEIGREQEEPLTEIHEDEDLRERVGWNWRPW